VACFPERAGHGDAGRSAAAGNKNVQPLWCCTPCFRHRAEAPVIPAVDSMTGRIFFSSAS
jgi:hypothetical protein